ncbi:hypothetical protein E2C01_012439 [Portunus trituberculatus]|uniref:Uncharacterized protein n=1 Tax=Portunus trituberculatus TaxID=210409 RepID=A0A5B7DEP5_PORTR|nr:hypothetical protein [Portunus trituberculatus]
MDVFNDNPTPHKLTNDKTLRVWAASRGLKEGSGPPHNKHDRHTSTTPPPCTALTSFTVPSCPISICCLSLAVFTVRLMVLASSLPSAMVY